MQPERERTITVTVNGQEHRRTVDVRMLLADFIREELELRGTHLGCEHGVCGACTVLIDDEPARSCLTLAVQADGMEIRTVEGLAEDGKLNRLQQAFQANHGLQCGFCTPGFLMTITYLLENEVPVDDEEELRELLSGNICRCTGYHGIVDAVQETAAALAVEKRNT